MNGWEEKLTKQLDSDKPRWWIEWASERELKDFTEIMQYGDAEGGLVRAQRMLRDSISRRLFHTILHAAIGAGIVSEK